MPNNNRQGQKRTAGFEQSNKTARHQGKRERKLKKELERKLETKRIISDGLLHDISFLNSITPPSKANQPPKTESRPEATPISEKPFRKGVKSQH